MSLSNSLNFPHPSPPDLFLFCTCSFCSYQPIYSMEGRCTLAQHFLLSHLCCSSSLHSALFIPDFVIFSGKANDLLVAKILSFCPFLIFTFIFIFPGSHDGDFCVIYGLLFGSGDGSSLERLLATIRKCPWRFTSHWVDPSKCLGLTIYLLSILSCLLL